MTLLQMQKWTFQKLCRPDKSFIALSRISFSARFELWALAFELRSAEEKENCFCVKTHIYNVVFSFLLSRKWQIKISFVSQTRNNTKLWKRGLLLGFFWMLLQFLKFSKNSKISKIPFFIMLHLGFINFFYFWVIFPKLIPYMKTQTFLSPISNLIDAYCSKQLFGSLD